MALPLVMQWALLSETLWVWLSAPPWETMTVLQTVSLLAMQSAQHLETPLGPQTATWLVPP